MGIVSRLLPLNLAGEKQTFFEDTAYNPQFEYDSVITKAELEQWGIPTKKMFLLADSISKKNVLKHEEKKATYEDVTQLVSELESKLTVPAISVVLDPTLVSRGKIKTSSLILKQPIVYTQPELIGMINHEIQTHMLRMLNEKKQPWHGEKKNIGQIIRTEEGLAILNAYQHLPQTVLRRCATGYISIYLAQRMSFAELFSTLVETYAVSPQRAWTLSVRAKRGLTDTAQIGGCTKDICYLEGAVAVWKWLSLGNNPKELYLGRISLEDISVKKTQSSGQIQYPTFFDDIEGYKSRVHELGLVNSFDTIEDIQ